MPISADTAQVRARLFGDFVRELDGPRGRGRATADRGVGVEPPPFGA